MTVGEPQPGMLAHSVCLREEWLFHERNAGARLGNALNQRHVVITKQASGTTEIDPLMEAIIAIALMSTNPWSSRPSIFVI
jgi:hypothetical protein